MKIHKKKANFLQKPLNDKTEVASEIDKGKSEVKPEERIAKRLHLRRGYVAKIKREDKIINNKFFKEYFTIYQSPSDMYKKTCEGKAKKMRIKHI